MLVCLNTRLSKYYNGIVIREVRSDLQAESFGHANRVIVLLDHVDSAQSAAGIIGAIIVEYGRVPYQQVQASVPVPMRAC